MAEDGEDAGSAGSAGGPLSGEGELAGEPGGGAVGGAGEESSDEQPYGGWGNSDTNTEGKATTIYGRDGGVAGTLPGSQLPTNIPNGSDDDIVARQIREAAMREPDPVLREKLWDEYRKYKEGQ